MRCPHLLLPLLITTALWLPTLEQDYRLPNIYIPEDYQVNLNVSSNAFTASGSDFSGTVAINFTVTEDTNDIKLHASHNDLRINMVVIAGHNIDVLDYNIDEVTDIFSIFYPVGLTADRPYLLTVDFSGNLSDDDDGFYKSSYKDDSGTTRYLATTQFETTSARRAFPCFDEPALKSTFDISITYPLGYHAISNTPGSVVSSDSVSETIQFETTPRMSTYLLAFVISDFTSQKTVAEDGVVHQVWSRNNTSNTRDWGIEIGPKALAALGAFTGFPYSNAMKKMDQGAIPDFSAGAMENWGLVLYREAALLWDEEKNSNTEKQSVATTITHEFSHQWFGDLVTLDWWSVTFLNEGFATFCEFNIASEILPDWQLVEQFVVDVVQPIMLSDSYESALALESEASTPEEIGNKFDGISYSKGGSVLRMVEHILGKDNFKAGVQNYVDQNKFYTAIPEKLWKAFNEKVNNTVSKLPAEFPVVMENWTIKAGYPVLQVTRGGSELTISQERYILSANYTDSTKWYVPISYTTSEDKDKFAQTSPSAWLTPDSDVTISLPDDASWVIVNNQFTGYYRVNYDDALWESIGAALRSEDFDGIAELNRAQIVDDLFSFFRADLVDYSVVLDFLEFLANDTSFITWVPAFNGFSNLLSSVGEYTDLGQAISAQILSLLTALYESSPASKPNRDDQVYTLKRVLVSNWACKLGNQDCIDYSLASFAPYKNEGAKLDNDLRYIICCNALRYGNNRSDYEFMLEVYQNATPAEQWYLYDVLYCSPYNEVTDILEQHLHKMIDEEARVDPEIIETALSNSYKQNPKAVDVAFNFLMDNHKAITKRYRTLNIGNILRSIAVKLSTRDHVAKLREVIEGDVSKEFISGAKAALDIAETNVQWVEKFEVKLRNYYKLN